MITTWQIISGGVETFTPVTERTLSIAQELILYFIFISVWILGVILIRNVILMILDYLKDKAEAIYWRWETRRFKKIINKHIDEL